MDQVEDEHLVQVQDHPAQMISVNFGFVKKVAVAIVKTQARNWIENLPWQTADKESGDDGDENEGEPLLSTSSSSTLPHLHKYQLTFISIPFLDLTIFCDPFRYFIF